MMRVVNDQRSRLPSDPDEPVRVSLMVPAGLRRAYMEVEELRGKMSAHVRRALNARMELNGYGMEKLRSDYEEVRERKLAVDAEYEIKRDTFHAAQRREWEHQQELLRKEEAVEVASKILDTVRARFEKWQGQERLYPFKVKRDRKAGTEWCARVLKDSEILRNKYGSPSELLEALRSK